jgi:hypothetical protein
MFPGRSAAFFTLRRRAGTDSRFSGLVLRQDALALGKIDHRATDCHRIDAIGHFLQFLVNCISVAKH